MPLLVPHAGSVLIVALLLSACATSTPSAPAAPGSTPVAATPAAGVPATGAPVMTAAQAADADQSICRRVDVLGSRVRKEKICKTKREWDLYEISKRETLRGIERGSSAAGPDPALGGG